MYFFFNFQPEALDSRAPWARDFGAPQGAELGFANPNPTVLHFRGLGSGGLGFRAQGFRV